MKIYEDCESISVFAFYKVIETKDYSYLLIDQERRKLTPEENFLCGKAFEKILKEFEGETVTSESIKDYKEQIRIKHMQMTYDSTVELLKLYELSEDINLLELLPALNWKFDNTKEIESQIKQTLAKLKGLKNRINIANLNYKARYRKEAKPNLPKFNLEKEAVKLSLSLKLGYMIKTKETPLTTWIHLTSINAEQQKLITDG